MEQFQHFLENGLIGTICQFLKSFSYHTRLQFEKTWNLGWFLLQNLFGYESKVLSELSNIHCSVSVKPVFHLFLDLSGDFFNRLFCLGNNQKHQNQFHTKINT